MFKEHPSSLLISHGAAEQFGSGHLKAGLLKRYFLHRSDVFAGLLGKNPCPFELPADETIETVLSSHTRESPTSARGVFQGHAEARAVTRVGAYQLAPDNTVKWMCIDVDGGPKHAAALAEPDAVALKIIDALNAHGIRAFLERSGGGEGWHVWVLFSEPVRANDARQLGLAVSPRDAACLRGGVADPEKSRGIEVFPKQAKLNANGVGNMVWLPLWGDAASGCSAFYRVNNGAIGHEYVPSDFETVSQEKVAEVIRSIRSPQTVSLDEKNKTKRVSEKG